MNTSTLDRETLEAVALETVSPEMYYQLSDTIGETDDSDLYRIIASNGDYSRERAWQCIMEGLTFADYVAQAIDLDTTSISAFEWRQLGGTR